MKKKILLMLLLATSITTSAQDFRVDGRLQPLLDEFFAICKSYDIDYHDKLFKLQSIDIVSNLTISKEGSTLGMLRRDDHGDVVAIDISWMAQLDPEILKVVAFHEFSHYFLEYSTHVCDDCGHIMSVVNSSYFDIVRDWGNQVKILFEESPALKVKYGSAVVAHPIKRS